MKQPDNSSSALSAQATRYKQFINKAVSLRKEGMNITAVIFWGVTDRTSWLGGYPLLFDGDYQAKPAYYSIIEDYTQGTITPTPTVTPTPSVTPTPTVTPTPSVTPIPGKAKPAVTVSTSNYGNTIGQKYSVTAEVGTIELSKVKIVFKADGMSTAEQNFWCDNAALQLNVAPWYTSLNGKVAGEVKDGSLTITINSDSTLAQGAGKMTMDIRFAKKDWSTYGTLTNPVIQVYYDGTLVQ